MPIYVHKCSAGHLTDVFRKLKDYNEPSLCNCGKPARRIITVTMISPDMQPSDSYISPASGKYITSYKDRRKDMAETGCVDYEPSLKHDVTKHWKSEEAKLDKAMDDTVEMEIEKMPIRKREKLAEELTSGADCEYTRI